jgi:hypothetical protein
MRPRDQEPVEKDIERLSKDEERSVVRKPGVPDDVKAEALERLERSEEIDREHERE